MVVSPDIEPVLEIQLNTQHPFVERAITGSMNIRSRESMPGRRRLLQVITLTWTVVLSAWLGYDYWVHEGHPEAVLALYGAALFLTAIVSVPVLVQKYNE